jgi:hypothetical protein
MKQGLTIVELATEIERQQSAKKDIVASTNVMKVEPTEAGLRLDVNKGAYNFGINGTCHKQIAAHTGIPMPYYDKMLREQPELLADNINTWFRANPQPRMLRTLDGNGRALLSDKFRPLENFDLAEAILPPLQRSGAVIMSAQITETKLYIKAVDERVKYDMPAGSKWGQDHKFFRTMSPGIVISNSEVGHGALSVETSIWDSICTNLATMGASVRKTHLGARHEIADGLTELLSDKTRRLTDAALWAQIGDVVGAAFEEARFKALVKEKIEVMVEQKIDGDPVKVVELTAKKFSLTETERTGVLKHLIEGGELSRYGLYNAITRTAEDLESYDRASEFEKMGGKIVELPRNEWQVLAEAA